MINGKDLVGAWCWVWDREDDPETAVIITEYREGKLRPYVQSTLVTWKHAKPKSSIEVWEFWNKAAQLEIAEGIKNER